MFKINKKPKLWTSYKTVIKSEGINNKNERTGMKEHQKWMNLFQSHWLTLEIQQHFASTWSFHKRCHSTQELWDWDSNGLQSPFPAHIIKYPHPDMGHICHSKIIKWVRFPVWCQWCSWLPILMKFKKRKRERDMYIYMHACEFIKKPPSPQTATTFFSG